VSDATRFGNWPAARMAAALASMIEEHGAPNSFSPGEIATYAPVKLERSFMGSYDRLARATDYGRCYAAICYLLAKHGFAVGYDLHARRFVVTAMPGDEGRTS
jgi:hypothetical protein